MSQNSFSVLMSVYEETNDIYLQQALQSILDQTLLPTQVVIVKDGPVSSPVDSIIQSFSKMISGSTQVDIVSLESNIGLGLALNRGLDACKHNLVARMDDDDISNPARFFEQVKRMSSDADLDVLGCWVAEFSDQFDNVGIRKVPLKVSYSSRLSRLKNPVNHPSVIFRKSSVSAVGGYRDIPGFEDFDLWLRMLKCSMVIKNIESSFVRHRISKNFYKRRHGWSYLKKQYYFYDQLRKDRVVDRLDMVLFLSFRSLPFLIPVRLKHMLYRLIR